eukprot:8164-Heterococcus_DN1.PRE.18
MLLLQLFHLLMLLSSEHAQALMRSQYLIAAHALCRLGAHACPPDVASQIVAFPNCAFLTLAGTESSARVRYVCRACPTAVPTRFALGSCLGSSLTL